MSNVISIDVIANASKAIAAFSKTEDAAKGIGGKLKSTGSHIKGFIGAAAGLEVVHKGFEFIKSGIEDVANNDRLLAQTAAVIKSTGGAANVTKNHIDNMSDRIEKMSGVEAESVINGANMLLTFKNIKNGVGKGNKIFDQTTQIMSDMSIATGQDMKNSALQLGKALNDPIKGVTALSRVGVTFTDDQKKQIAALQKSGDVMGAQKVILKELKSEFGGSAKAAGKTFAGQLNILSAKFGDVKESIIRTLLPSITKLLHWMVQKGVPLLQKFVSKGIAYIVPKLKRFGAYVKTELWPVIKQLGEVFIKSVVPAIKTLAKWVGDTLVPAFAKFAGLLASHKSVIIGVVAAFVAWKAAMAGVAIAQGAMKIVSFGKGVVSAGKAVAAMAQSQKLAAAASKVMAAGQWVLNAAMSANPITLVVLAIAALVAGFIVAYKKSETFRKIVNGALQGVKKVALSVFNWLKNAVGAVIDFIKNHWKLLISIMGGPLVAVVVLVTKNWGKIKNIIRAVVTWIKEKVPAFMRSMRDKVGDVLNSLNRVFQSILGKIKSIALSVFKWLVVYPARQMGRLLSKARSIFTSIYKAISSKISDAKNRVVNLISQMRERVISILGKVRDGIVNIGRRIVKAFTDSFKTAVDRIASAIRKIHSKINDLVGFFRNIPSRVLHALGNMGHVLYSAGKNLLGGFLSGIRAEFDHVMDVLSDLGSRIKDKVTGMFGINSPSRWGIEMGQFIVLGIARGLRDVSAVRAIGALSSDMQSALVAPKLNAQGLATGAGTNVEVTVNVPPTVNKAEVGREIQSALDDYYRSGGRKRA